MPGRPRAPTRAIPLPFRTQPRCHHLPAAWLPPPPRRPPATLLSPHPLPRAIPVRTPSIGTRIAQPAAAGSHTRRRRRLGRVGGNGPHAPGVVDPEAVEQAAIASAPITAALGATVPVAQASTTALPPAGH